MESKKTDQRVVAIIPARGGSKRIPKKNVIAVAGKPLIGYSIEHARLSKLVTRIVVSTDDQEIKEIAQAYGAEVVLRPKEISDDEASSESALVHVLEYLHSKEGYEPDIVVFLQCTSPARQRNDIDNAIRLILEKNADSLFSACRNDKFIWFLDHDVPTALNYDYKNRKREQVFPLQYRENGSLYVFKPAILKKCNNRLGGKIVIYEMDYWDSFQIDSPEEVELMEWILTRKSRQSV